jgi:hypothetical protein
MTKKKPAAAIDPAQLAAGYMFPDLFTEPPFTLVSEAAADSPFAPSAAVQHTMPGMPPVDWEHIRRQRAAARTTKTRRQKQPTVFTHEQEPS